MELVITYTIEPIPPKFQTLEENKYNEMYQLTPDDILDEVVRQLIPDDIDIDWDSSKKDRVEMYVYSDDFEYINTFFTSRFKGKKIKICGVYTITFHSLMKY